MRRLNPREPEKSRNWGRTQRFREYPLAKTPLPKLIFLGQSGVENDPPPPQDLFRTAPRPFRWHPLLRSRRRAAEIAGRRAALAVRLAPRAPELARLGAEPACRHPSRARRRRQGAAVLHRTCQLADPDRGPEHPGRSGLV